MRSLFCLMLCLLHFVSLLCAVKAGLEAGDLDAVHTLMNRKDGCPDKLEFKRANRPFPAEDIVADGEEYTGGQLYLRTMVPAWGTTGQKWRYFWRILRRKAQGRDGKESDFLKDKRHLVVKECVYFDEEPSVEEAPCFSGSSTVRMADGTTKTMDRLSTGDVVQSDTTGATSPVLAWTHKGHKISARFVSATTPFGSLVATVGHYVFTASEDRTELVRMKDLTVGMKLVHESGVHAPILSLSKYSETGVWNPQTRSGSIVVDGFVASCYTEALAPSAAHALLAPVRVVASAGMSQIWDFASSFVSGGYAFV